MKGPAAPSSLITEVTSAPLKSMKKKLLVIAALFTLLTGCGSKIESSEIPLEIDTSHMVVVSPHMDADIDFSVMDDEEMEKQYSSIVTFPESYIGKTMKMTGFLRYAYDNDENVYPTCVVVLEDGCELSLEFVLFGEDYPNEYDYFTVAGTFEKYEQNGNAYFHLENARLQK